MSENKSLPPATSAAILVLEAFEHIDTRFIKEYEGMAQIIDERVKENEPGMLVHALTEVSVTKDETIYRWLEVYENPNALKAHLDNPHVQNHIAKLENGMLSSPTRIIIYADWDKVQHAYWVRLLGENSFELAPLKSGFFLER